MTAQLPGRLKLWVLSLLTLLLPTGIFLMVDTSGAAAQTDRLVRVGLITNSQSVSFSTDGGYQLVDTATGRVITDLAEGATWQVTPEGSSQTYILSASATVMMQPTDEIFALGQEGNSLELGLNNAYMASEDGVPRLGSGITVSSDTKFLGTFTGPLQVRKINTAANNRFTLNDKHYRGTLEFRLDKNSSITVVNELPLEEYLYGVVPAEMPSSWPMEALKAQAVAARNYVILQQHSGRFAANGFDVTATDLSQVYGGFSAEKERTNIAVEETSGVVMLADGKPINAVYHSSSGGYTENSEEVWSYPTSYLKTKVDTLDLNTLHYNWQYPTNGLMTMDEVRTKLMAVKGWNFATINNITIDKRTSSGQRIQALRIEGTDQNGNALVQRLANADTVRSAFGLKSAPREIWLDIGADQKPTGIVFRGSGWGHGLGMSQWGARGMAQASYNYRSILQNYYTDITIVEDYGE